LHLIRPGGNFVGVVPPIAQSERELAAVCGQLRPPKELDISVML
jgi:hypothetical protein